MVKRETPITRRYFALAARDLQRQGLTPRDIGELLGIGTAAAVDLLKPFVVRIRHRLSQR